MNLSIPLLRFFLFCSLLISITSCKKNADPVSPPTKDSTALHAALSDTGNNIIGATMLTSMSVGLQLNPQFKSSPPIALYSQHNVVISGLALTNISLYNCTDITIKNCMIGPGMQLGINIQQCSHIVVDSCYLYKVPTGVYATDSQAISITNCQAENMLGPFPEGQFVQFKNVTGAGNRVSFNKFQNILGESDTEDAISMYNSNGLPDDPIVIESNWIRGGGPSLSGGGIMLGDGGGSNMIAKDNILVDPGQYGMAVSGGSYMSIINNTIYAKEQSFTNVGLYYRNYSGPPSQYIRIAKNAVNYINSKGLQNDTYLGPGDSSPMGWTTNSYNAGLTETILPGSIVSGLIFK